MNQTATVSRSHATKRPQQPDPRPRRSIRRTVTRVVVSIMVLAVVAAAGWLVGASSLLAAHQVIVSGTRVLDPAQVRGLARVQLGVPLARQDVKEMARRVATLRPVRTVTVERDWPQAIKISVVERTPVLAVRQPTGYDLIDAQGVDFLTVATIPGGVLPAEIDPTNRPLLVSAGIVVAALPKVLWRQVARIQAISPNAITLQLSNGRTVLWGGADESDLKAAVTIALLKHKARSYDVSAPHSPATNQ